MDNSDIYPEVPGDRSHSARMIAACIHVDIYICVYIYMCICEVYTCMNMPNEHPCAAWLIAQMCVISANLYVYICEVHIYRR